MKTTASAPSNKERKTIEQEKKEKKFIFQFINHENGKRSEALIGNWDSVREVLDLREKDQAPTNDDYILLVAVLGDDAKETTIPATPLITVKTFMNYKENK